MDPIFTHVLKVYVVQIRKKKYTYVQKKSELVFEKKNRNILRKYFKIQSNQIKNIGIL